MIGGGVTLGLGLIGLISGGLLIRSASQPDPPGALPPCSGSVGGPPDDEAPCDSSNSAFADVGRVVGGFLLVIVSAVPAVGGGVMLGIGGARHHRYRQYRNLERSVRPSVQRSSYGTWTAGVALRF